MRKHCMVDLETFGTLPGSAIVSIGAVVFTQDKIWERWHQTVDIQSNLDAGLEVDGKTLEFWLRDTTDTARQSLFEKTLELRWALGAFNCFWVNAGCNWLWAHGTTFDIPMLDKAYAATGYTERPWHFRNVRDTRTLFSLLPLSYIAPLRITEKHDALKDAEYQALAVQSAYQTLGLEMEA